MSFSIMKFERSSLVRSNFFSRRLKSQKVQQPISKGKIKCSVKTYRAWLKYIYIHNIEEVVWNLFARPHFFIFFLFVHWASLVAQMIKNLPGSTVLRLWKNRMGRPLSPSQIHQKIIWTLSKFHKTTSERWQRTPGTQKGSPLSLKWGRTKYKW